MVGAENKTDAVSQRLADDLLAGALQPGGLVPSEREMMALADVSRVTVRRAYAELEERGVIERQHGKGAFISEQLRGHASEGRLIGVLTDCDDYYAVEFLDALECAVSADGGLLVLRQTKQDPKRERKALGELLAQGVQDLVVWPSGGQFDQAYFHRARILGANLVLVDRMRPQGGWADFVGSDATHMMHALLDTLPGCKCPALISYDGVGWDSFGEREAAYLAVCDERGLAPRIARVPWTGAGTSLRRGRDVGKQLADDKAAKALAACEIGAADALIAVNDYLALQCQQVFAKLPVVGVDALPESAMAGIASYRHDLSAIARKAVARLRSQRKQGINWKAQSKILRGEVVR